MVYGVKVSAGSPPARGPTQTRRSVLLTYRPTLSRRCGILSRAPRKFAAKQSWSFVFRSGRLPAFPSSPAIVAQVWNRCPVAPVLPLLSGGGEEGVEEIHSCQCTHARSALARNAPALSWFLFHRGARLVRATLETHRPGADAHSARRPRRQGGSSRSCRAAAHTPARAAARQAKKRRSCTGRNPDTATTSHRHPQSLR